MVESLEFVYRFARGLGDGLDCYSSFLFVLS
jgi:hypothetical protein